MDSSNNKLTVTIVYEQEDYELSVSTNEYRSLMMLIYDKIAPDGFGECLGMGKCGTCMVEILSCRHEPTAYQRNEHTTLLRQIAKDRNVRLSCQLLVDEKIDGLKVSVLL